MAATETHAARRHTGPAGTGAKGLVAKGRADSGVPPPPGAKLLLCAHKQSVSV